MRRFGLGVLFAGFVAVTGCQSEPEPTDDTAADEAALAADPSAALLEQDIDAWKIRFAGQVARWKQLEPRTESGRAALPGMSDGIDWVFIPALESQTNLVIMNAGIHGVEAPAGVAFEDILLNECALAPELDRKTTAILVIHVMNPYGARHGRRFNENNVDLNRNSFLPADSFPGLAIDNPEYEQVRGVVENRMNVADFIGAGISYGAATMTKALSGQYDYPKGIYYGGSELQPSVIAVEELVARVAQPFKNVAFADVHTGLGTALLGVITTNSGVNQVMMNPIPADADAPLKAAFEREKALLGRMFPAAECDDVCAIQEADEHGFVTSGDITQWLQQHFADKRKTGTVLSFTAEISTNAPASVLESLADENYCHWNRNASSCGERQYARDVAALRESFNPSRARWRRHVMTAGRQMCKALARFSNEK